ncbi:hypothetical protein Tco_1200730 [Tanacetum coccineum]
MLKRCEDTNLSLNWEKSHFMVKEGIVLGHKISKSGIEVDRAKVEVIAKLPHPTTVKGVVFRGKKLLTFLKLATVDPPGDTWCPITQQESILLSILLATIYKMPYDFVNRCDDLAIQGFSDCEALTSQEVSHLSFILESIVVITQSRFYHQIFDSKIKNRVFNVGDRVLLFNSRLKIFSGKLKTRWSGPFTVTQVFPYGTVELSQNSGPNFKVNGHRLKHYFGGDVPTEDFPDCEDSCALSFIFHPQEFHILSFILGIQYPNLID